MLNIYHMPCLFTRFHYMIIHWICTFTPVHVIKLAPTTLLQSLRLVCFPNVALFQRFEEAGLSLAEEKLLKKILCLVVPFLFMLCRADAKTTMLLCIRNSGEWLVRCVKLIIVISVASSLLSQVAARRCMYVDVFALDLSTCFNLYMVI